jgi:uncharacterized membrane protein AbrB (regulator of aidB expression)
VNPSDGRIFYFRIVCFSLLAIAGIFLAVQATLLVRGHTRDSATYGIVASLSTIAASLLNIWLIYRARDKNTKTPP